MPGEFVHQRFSDDLIITYAEDMPTTMRFMTNADLAPLNLTIHELHELAIENLRKRIPRVCVRQEQGVYRLVCDGNYEASLVFADTILDQLQSKFPGELILAVPAKNCLLVAGSEDKQRVRKIAELAQKVAADSSHPLSPNLLVRRRGQFIKY